MDIWPSLLTYTHKYSVVECTLCFNTDTVHKFTCHFAAQDTCTLRTIHLITADLILPPTESLTRSLTHSLIYSHSFSAQGLLQCVQSLPSASSLLPSLWSHEAVRVFCDGVSRERDYLWFHEAIRLLEFQMAKSLGLQEEGGGHKEFVTLTSLPLDHQSAKDSRESGLTAVPKVRTYVCVTLHSITLPLALRHSHFTFTFTLSPSHSLSTPFLVGFSFSTEGVE